MIWSPNARRLLLYGYANGEIRLAQPDRPGEQLVARGGRPSWSPDSGSFAFASRRAIVVVETPGTRGRLIQIPPGQGCPPSVCSYREDEATWSPTGNTVAYVHITVWHGSKGTSSLWTVDSSGSDVQQLPSRFAVTDPAWSPTADKIAFLQYDDFEDDVLHVIDLATRRNTRLAPAWAFAWSPRGNMIVAFASDGDGPTYAELFRVSDGWRRRLPSWSPRGDTIAFAAAACGPRQGIWLLRVATGVARRVSRGCRTVRP